MKRKEEFSLVPVLYSFVPGFEVFDYVIPLQLLHSLGQIIVSSY